MRNPQKLVELIKNSDSVLIASHENPDPDSVASMLLVRKIVEKYSPEAKIILLVDKITGKLDEISRRYDVEFTEEITDASLGVLVDTNSLSNFNKIKHCGKKLLIDHHAPKPGFLKNFDFYIVEERTTCSEILLDILNKLDICISREEALLVLGAIVYDTVWLRIGGPRTYKTVYELLKKFDIQMEDVYLWNFTEEDSSRILAKVKAIRRGDIHRVKDHIAIFTNVSSYLGYVSKELVLFGFDLAAVVGKKGDTIVSVKCSGRLLEKDVNLVEWLDETGIFYDFGGHRGAAGGRSKKPVEEVLSVCKKVFLKKMREIL